MRCEEMPELITALLDDEASAAERAAAQGHLAQCPNCQARYEQERALRRQLRSAAAKITAPAALRHRIDRTFAEQGKTQRVRIWAAWFSTRALRPAFAAMLVLLALSSWMYLWRPADNIGLAALAIHEEILAGRKGAAPADDLHNLREQLAQGVDGRFAPVALDLSMMNLYPVAGFVQRIGGREVLVTIYKGHGPTVTCFTFLGAGSDAPEAAEVFYDASMKMNFYSFSRADIHGVLHQEEKVICLLASKRSPAELLVLLRGKPGHA